MQVQPTVKTDFKSRVIAFDDKAEAEAEAAGQRSDGRKARVIVRNAVFNVVVS